MASSYGTYRETSQISLSASQSPSLLPETSSSLRDRKKKQQQPRQLLSCTKCRERKVKCDRTKPCSACCARGLPKECHFVLGEGTEFGPIQQSLELRKLRSENQKLKERLIAAKLSLSDDSEDDDGSSTEKPGPNNRRAASRQKRFKTSEHTDSLYFGSPGLANVIQDFANMQMDPKSLAFTMPRGAEMYAGHNSMYPFPALWKSTTATEGLLQCLEPHDALLKYIDVFGQRAVGFACPFLPEGLSRKEVDSFLQDAGENAQRRPDALALIFAGAALGMQLDGGHEDVKSKQDRLRNGDVFIAGVMQSLRASAFMSRPTLRSVQALLMVGPYLTNSGRFLDAWSLFGLTIRLGQSIGLHRNPKYLDPIPDLRECTMRSNIWWWMLHTDQLYSMTLGRPLGISGIGDCSPAEPLTTDPAVLRMGEFVDQLTLLGRQILSSSQLTDARIDMFTDRLIALWDTMPDTLQFNETWSSSNAHLPEWPLCASAATHYCKIHNYIILLNRQRIENARASPEYSSPSPTSLQPMSYHESSLLRPNAVPRGRAMVMQASLALLDAFIYFQNKAPIALIDWTVGQQAFNACLILILDALETSTLHNIGKVEQAYAVFAQLEKDGKHELAALAVSRISEGLLRIRDAAEKGPLTLMPTRPHGRRSIAVKERTSSYNSSSEAESSTSRYYDESVMGSTGMFLLEDPGLQSNEALATSTSRRSGPLPPSSTSHSTSPINLPLEQAQHRPSIQLQPQQADPTQHGYPPQQNYTQGFPPHQPIAYPTQPHHTNSAGREYVQPPGYGAVYQLQLDPRKDSVTTNSGFLMTQTLESTSPHAYISQQVMQGSTLMQQYQAQTSMISHQQQQQQPFSAPQPTKQQKQQRQLSEQDWQALQMQRLAHAQALQQQQHGQSVPSHRQPGGKR